MENYTITKEQILKLANKAEQGCTSVIESDLKNWFPEAFKKELEIGKWYKGIGRNFLVNYQGDDDTNYGFWGNLPFKNDIHFGQYWVDECREATPEEVEVALINESKKLGIKEGVFVSRNLMHANTDNITLPKGEKYFYDFIFDILYLNEKEIYSNGVFAKVLPQEKTVVPMEKALKIIAKKMKVSPENIEIQY